MSTGSLGQEQAVRKPLGQRLVEREIVTEQQLAVALKEQHRTGQLLGEILVRLGFTTDAIIASVVSSQSGEDFFDPSQLEVSPEVLALVPETVAREHLILPVETGLGTLKVAMVDTFDVATIDSLASETGLDIIVVACAKMALLSALDRLYTGQSDSNQRLETSIQAAGENLLGDSAGETPIITLVEEVIGKAVSLGATDIHIEPQERVVCIRNRIDGILRGGDTIPKALQSAVESRIKIMAKLDISERRLPQDGRIQMSVMGREIDLRVSTLPSVDGENIVLRILDRDKVVLSLEDLGFNGEHMELFQAAVKRPHGIVLVTGPTGSGKTTTLYAGLMEVDALELNVMTLEDPVEYRIPVIRQSQVQPRAGYTFAEGLRALLRQDPDVILVGEMRDGETADLAMRAAMTGHLVLSTLHTNDAAGALPRLVEMGVSPYLLPSTIVAILSQRLARRPCKYCKQPYTPTDDEFAEFGRKPHDGTFFTAIGCDKCSGSGYLGRTLISEVLCMSPAVGELVMASASGSAIHEAALADGMIDMREDGFRKASMGLITLDEVRRVAERRLTLKRTPQPEPEAA